jgi:hypothetical protein
MALNEAARALEVDLLCRDIDGHTWQPFLLEPPKLGVDLVAYEVCELNVPTLHRRSLKS